MNGTPSNIGVTIEQKADFWWVVVDGKPSFPCTTKAEADEIVAAIVGGI